MNEGLTATIPFLLERRSVNATAFNYERTYWDAPFYDQMRQRAVGLIRARNSDDALQAEDLVHDAYLRLSSSPVRGRVNDTQHYFAIASRAMKRSLVDRTRAANAAKRFSHLQRTELTKDVVCSNDKTGKLPWITELLEKCTSKGERFGTVARMHFLEERSVDEIGHVLHISTRTVKRDLRTATRRLRELC